MWFDAIYLPEQFDWLDFIVWAVKSDCPWPLCVSVSLSQDLIVDQTIEKVSFCAPDRNYDKAFSYICRDGTTRRWMCHCFMAIKDSVRGQLTFHPPLRDFPLDSASTLSYRSFTGFCISLQSLIQPLFHHSFWKKKIKIDKLASTIALTFRI